MECFEHRPTVQSIGHRTQARSPAHTPPLEASAKASPEKGEEEGALPELRLDLRLVERIELRRTSEVEAISPTQEVKQFDAGLVGAGARPLAVNQ